MDTTPSRRLAITLGDFDGAPYIIADCDLKGWNGYHVPRITGPILAAHLGALEAAEPGTGWDAIVTTSDTGFIVHNCAMAGCPGDGTHHNDEDDVVLTDDDGYAWLDGYVWTTARDADGVDITPDRI
jgi:hypothetical protein